MQIHTWMLKKLSWQRGSEGEEKWRARAAASVDLPERVAPPIPTTIGGMHAGHVFFSSVNITITKDLL
jgi:hypothetical protein